MAEYIKTLKEDNNDITYPITVSDAVFVGNDTLTNKISGYVTAQDIASTSAITPTITSSMIDWTTLNVLIDTSPAKSSFFGGSYSHTFSAPVAGYYEINTPFSCLCHRVANALNVLSITMDNTEFFSYTYASESGDTEWGMSRRTISSAGPITIHLSAGSHTLRTSGDLYYDSSIATNSYLGTITAKLVKAD